MLWNPKKNSAEKNSPKRCQIWGKRRSKVSWMRHLYFLSVLFKKKREFRNLFINFGWKFGQSLHIFSFFVFVSGKGRQDVFPTTNDGTIYECGMQLAVTFSTCRGEWSRWRRKQIKNLSDMLMQKFLSWE